jgi:DNA polymerase V
MTFLFVSSLVQSIIPVPECQPSGDLPLLSGIAAGFPSPATDFSESGLDLNAYLIRHRAASFYFSVEGDSMSGAGILDGDKVLVDRAVEPQHGHIVVAVVNSEYTLKRLYRRREVLELHAENPSYSPIRFREGEELQVWGVVVGVVRKYGA